MSDTWLWHRLERQLNQQIADFPGVAGACVRPLVGEGGVSLRGDTLFPTASSIKIHILTQLLLKAEREGLDLNQPIALTPDMQSTGSGVLMHLEGALSLSLLDLAILMIIVSDNTATNLCIDHAGMAATNELLRELGLTQTTLRRKMMDQEAIIRNDENVSTPDEMVQMMQHLYDGKPTPQVAEKCLAILQKPKKGLLNRALPGVAIANKPGGMERVRCDVGIVYLPRRSYAVAVMSKFGLTTNADLERDVIALFQCIHQTMTALDATSRYGQGIQLPG